MTELPPKGPKFVEIIEIIDRPRTSPFVLNELSRSVSDSVEVADVGDKSDVLNGIGF